MASQLRSRLLAGALQVLLLPMTHLAFCQTSVYREMEVDARLEGEVKWLTTGGM
jgi:hypothetical protein